MIARPLIVHATILPWQRSPSSYVWRLQLARNHGVVRLSSTLATRVVGRKIAMTAVGEEEWKEVAKEQVYSSEPLWEQLEDLAELPPLPSYQHSSADAHVTIGTGSAAQPKCFLSSSGLQTTADLLPHLGNSIQRTFTEDMQDALNTSSSWGSEEWVKALDANDILPEVDMEMLADDVLGSRCLAPAEHWHGGSSGFRLRLQSAGKAKDCTVNSNQVEAAAIPRLDSDDIPEPWRQDSMGLEGYRFTGLSHEKFSLLEERRAADTSCTIRTTAGRPLKQEQDYDAADAELLVLPMDCLGLDPSEALPVVEPTNQAAHKLNAQAATKHRPQAGEQAVKRQGIAVISQQHREADQAHQRLIVRLKTAPQPSTASSNTAHCTASTKATSKQQPPASCEVQWPPKQPAEQRLCQMEIRKALAAVKAEAEVNKQPGLIPKELAAVKAEAVVNRQPGLIPEGQAVLEAGGAVRRQPGASCSSTLDRDQPLSSSQRRYAHTQLDRSITAEIKMCLAALGEAEAAGKLWEDYAAAAAISLEQLDEPLPAHLNRRAVVMLWPILRLRDQCLSACLQRTASADAATSAAMDATGCDQEPGQHQGRQSGDAPWLHVFQNLLRNEAMHMWSRFLHFENPVPSRQQKLSFASYLQKDYKQVSDWFTNYRARRWRSEVEVAQEEARDAATRSDDKSTVGRDVNEQHHKVNDALVPPQAYGRKHAHSDA